MNDSKKTNILKGHVRFLKSFDAKAVNYSVLYSSVKHTLELANQLGIKSSDKNGLNSLSHTFHKELEFAATSGEHYAALSLIKSDMINLEPFVDKLKIASKE
jgi:hypothetical protein